MQLFSNGHIDDGTSALHTITCTIQSRSGLSRTSKKGEADEFNPHTNELEVVKSADNETTPGLSDGNDKQV